MALKATIYKAELQLTDLDRHHYQTYPLTLARHPSETEERLIVRLLAFTLHASAGLSFTKGLSTQEEPDLWEHTDSGELSSWIELGQPDERRIRQACGRARQVVIYCYSGHSAEIWWRQCAPALQGIKNLTVYYLPPAQLAMVVPHLSRSIQWQLMIQDGECWLSAGTETLTIQPEGWMVHGALP